MGKDLKGKELGEGLSQRKSDGLYMGRYKGKCVYDNSFTSCKKKYIELVKSVDNGTYIENRKAKMDDYFHEWLELRHNRHEIKESSEFLYKQQYNAHIKKVFGNMRLEKITVSSVKQFQASLIKQGLKPATINSITGVLSQILKSAVKDELLVRNPAEVLETVKEKKDSKEKKQIHRALTREEQRLFMEYAKEEWYYNIFDLQLRTGMRIGEIRGLRWSDIDHEKNVIRIKRTATRNNSGKLEMGDPKTKTSYRDIPLRKDIDEIFVRQKQQCRLIEGKTVNFDDYVFKSVKGKVISTETIRDVTNRILRNMKKDGIQIERFTSHTFRYTFATRAIEAGMNPQTLKTILGHSSLQMTMDLYSQVLPNVKQEEMKKIADVF